MNISSDPEMTENMQQKVATFTLKEDQMIEIKKREIDLKISNLTKDETELVDDYLLYLHVGNR